ncbi:hypothetical protein O181_101608, partial [Austropuccinia psidii MF-1]|nr:hypothetical protein [Austropuccinia psidii MF-1]
MLYAIINWITISVRSSRVLCGFVNILWSARPPPMLSCVACCFGLLKQEATPGQILRQSSAIDFTWHR